MDKREFLDILKSKLGALPKGERDKSAEYYAEMLDEMTEDGMSEEEAVASLGDVDAIARELTLDAPLTAIIKERVKPKRKLSGLEITLLIVGFPLWGALAIAAAAVIFAVYATIWSVLIAVYATAFAVCIAAAALLVIFVLSFFMGSYSFTQRFLFLGAAFISAGVGILLVMLSVKATGLITALTKLLGRAIKRLFVKKEAAK